jgi:cytochrome P450
VNETSQRTPLPAPPGPRGSLLAGSLKPFADRRLDWLIEMARAHGPVCTFRLGPRRCMLVNDPDLIEQVLVTDAKHYIKHFGARMYKPLLGNGLVTSEGDFWLRQRKLAQPAFLKNRLPSYAPAMTELADEMARSWQPGKRIDVAEEMSRLTGAIALRTLFGASAIHDQQAYHDAHVTVGRLIHLRFRKLIHWPEWMPLPSHLRVKKALKLLHSIVEGFIREGRSRAEPGDDLLSMLLRAQDIDGSQMTDVQLRDETMTLFLAGHETTALTLSWTWYLLAKHPEVEAKLAAEWASILGGRIPTANDIPRLTFTEQVIQESMRLYPAVYLIGREPLKDVELGGYRVKKGTTVFFSQWVSHRDAKYFDDPEAFRPERWADGLAKRLPKYAYYPFGGGPRVCIGNTFAMMEAVLLLTTLGQRWRFTLDPNAQVTPAPGITLKPSPGVPATLEPRLAG